MFKRKTNKSNNLKRSTSSSELKVNKSRLERNKLSQPKIVITKKDSLELIDIVDDDRTTLREKLGDSMNSSGNLDAKSSVSENTKLSDLDSDSETVYERVSSMRTVADSIHFPKPNDVLLKAIERTYLQAAQMYETTVSVCSPGDPAASRLLAFLSSVCFDVDFCLRYTLRLHPADEEDFDDVNSVASSDVDSDAKSKQNKRMTRRKRIFYLGTFGRTADKMSILARVSLKFNKAYSKKLFILGNYDQEQNFSIRGSFASLAKAFARIGEMSAEFSNKLYSGTRFFTIEKSPIGLNATSFDSPFLLENRRIDRKSYITFMQDAEKNFTKCLQIFDQMTRFWDDLKEADLHLNHYERLLLHLERMNACLFSPVVDPCVKFSDKEYLRENGQINLDRFWEKFEVYPSEASNGAKIQKYCEKRAMQSKFRNGVKVDLAAIAVFKARKDGEESENKEVESKRKTRTFAKKLGL